MGNNVQTTSLHTLFGSNLLSQKKSFLCISGLTLGTPIELETLDISKFSPSAPLPSINDLLNISSLLDLENIDPIEDFVEKVRNLAVLVPILVEELLNLQGLSPKNVLFTIIKTIQKLEQIVINDAPLHTQEPEEEEVQDLQGDLEEHLPYALL